MISLTINCANKSFSPEAIRELIDQIKTKYIAGEVNVITIHAQEDANSTFEPIVSAAKGIAKWGMRTLLGKDASFEIKKSTVIGQLFDAMKQDPILRDLVKAKGTDLISESSLTMTQPGEIGSIGIGAIVLGADAKVLSSRTFNPD